MVKEIAVSTAKAFKSGNSSLVVVIPQELVNLFHVKDGTKFLVKTDEETKIIYEFTEVSD